MATVPALQGKLSFPPNPGEGAEKDFTDIKYVYQKWGAWKAVYEPPTGGGGTTYTGTNGVGFTSGSTTQFQANIVGLTTR